MKGTIKSAQNIEEGSITTKDEDTGQITRPTEYLYNMGSTLGGIGAGTARSIARTAGEDGEVLGIMGGRKMKSAPSKLEQLKEFETKAAKKDLDLYVLRELKVVERVLFKEATSKLIIVSFTQVFGTIRKRQGMT